MPKPRKALAATSNEGQRTAIDMQTSSNAGLILWLVLFLLKTSKVIGTKDRNDILI